MNQNNRNFVFALKKSIPITISYFFVAIAYGLVMQQNGYHWLWSVFASIFIYTGAFQFVLASFLGTDASLLTIALTCGFMSTRQIFYGLSYVDDFKKTGKFLPYMIHSLTDESYALYNSIVKYPDTVSKPKAQLYIGILCQAGWVAGSAVGGLVGNLIPSTVQGVDFALTALFITIVVDQWRHTKVHLPALIGLGCAVFFLLFMGKTNFLLPALISTSALLILTARFAEVEHAEE